MECFAKSIEGASHIKTQKPCQDSSGCFSEGIYHLAVVSDGHGGEEYFRSDRGSRFAVETAREVIGGFIKKQTGGITESDIKTIEKNMVNVWREKVLADIKTHPWTPEEKLRNPSPDDTSIYGATLLAAAIADQFWFALQIGDGVCALIDAGGSRFAFPDDATQGLGRTHSLCEENAPAHFRHAFGKNGLLGVTVATDGVSDAIPADTYLFKFTINILKAFVENPVSAEKELEDTLPKLTQMGSQDDVSIACIFNAEAARPYLDRITEIAEIQLNYKTVEKENVSLKKKFDISIKNLTSEKDELVASKSDLTRKVNRLENELRDETAKRRQAETDLDTWKNRYEEKDLDLRREKSARNSFENEKYRLKKDMEEKEKEIQSLKEKIKQLEKKNKDLQYANEQYERQLNEVVMAQARDNTFQSKNEANNQASMQQSQSNSSAGTADGQKKKSGLIATIIKAMRKLFKRENI
jgi:predicted  nucleic acid-binding Zn-ribbon protein